MIEVVVRHRSAVKIVDIVQELRELGLVSGDDFEFSYYKAEWDSRDDAQYTRYTVFQFKDEATATWFSLKYAV